MTPPAPGLLARLEARLRLTPLQVDVALASAIGVLVAYSTRYPSGLERAVGAALVALPLVARRRWPMPVLALVATAVLATHAEGGVPDIVAVAIAAYSVGELVEDRLVSPAWTLGVATAIAAVLGGSGSGVVLAIGLPFAVIVPSWVVGDTVRNRRLDAARRREEADRREREREAALRGAVADERRHMARELHDIVAHGVSLMLIQTGAARQVVRSAPDAAEESLLAAESTGRDALAELRRLLDLLNDEGEAPALAPQPGLDQLEALVARVREAGLPAKLEVAGDRRALPAGLDVTAYRIAQEALTNALRHTRAAPTLVRLVFEPDQLRLEVLDDGPAAEDPAEDAAPDGRNGTGGEGGGGAPPRGRGLAGMGERAAGVGGRLEAGPRVGGGYAVRAWLPLRSDAP